MKRYVKSVARYLLSVCLFMIAVIVTFQFITGFSGKDLLSWFVLRIK